MNAPAAIRATYSDLRLVKGRKVAVIYLEIPIEQAEQFVGAFGMPNPAEEKWVGIARLDGDAKEVKPAEPKERQKFSRLRPSAQAALLCDKPAFWKYLNSPECDEQNVFDEGSAATFVRTYCMVASRSELDRDEQAAGLWFGLRDAFDSWSFAA